ncbi:MAG: dihydroorotase [Nitrosomonas sp.]|nr:dihydroorotase [Nitrosomonas sp.]
MPPQTITITQPDDWHLHLRDDKQMQSVLPDSARRFARAIVMPNLKPPVTTTDQAIQYRSRIMKALPNALRSHFNPLMTLYLTDNTTPQEVEKAKKSGVVHAVKFYPAGATTNSDAGVTDLSKCSAVLAIMERLELPLLVHGEVTDPVVDIFDRESVFIDRVLSPLIQRFPALRIILEHITTRAAVEFILSSSNHIAATITAHHLLFNRNAVFTSGIRPHYYCLPILKREEHRQALVAAAISGSPKFFLGTDSAPHSITNKESHCGCAGIYTAHAAIEFYAEAFDRAGALDKLEAFASFHGADFYQLPRNIHQVTLLKQDWVIPEQIRFGDEQLIPLMAGEKLSWKLNNQFLVD